MSADAADDAGDLGISLAQKMLSAVTGSVLTSLLGASSLCLLTFCRTAAQVGVGPVAVARHPRTGVFL
jgi:hypothetical protein